MKHVRLYEDHQPDRDFLRDLEKIGLQDEIKMDGFKILGSHKNFFNWDKEVKVLRDWNDEHPTKIVGVIGDASYTEDYRRGKNKDGTHNIDITLKDVIIQFSNNNKITFNYLWYDNIREAEFRYYNGDNYNIVKPTAIASKYLLTLGVFDTIFKIFRKFHPKDYNSL